MHTRIHNNSVLHGKQKNLSDIRPLDLRWGVFYQLSIKIFFSVEAEAFPGTLSASATCSLLSMYIWFYSQVCMYICI